MFKKIKIFQYTRRYEGWGLSHGNYFVVARLIVHEETWKYTNESG